MDGEVEVWMYRIDFGQDFDVRTAGSSHFDAREIIDMLHNIEYRYRSEDGAFSFIMSRLWSCVAHCHHQELRHKNMC